MTKLTVKDLFEKKGKVKLTELYVTNALEAYAAEKAGIDIQIVSFKKETLRTGVPTNKWFRDAHIKDIREAARAFTGWNTRSFKSDEKEDDAVFKGHPMLIRQAAYIYDGEEFAFVESINKMNPEGKEAREITEYCTSKCLEVLSTEQQKVMHSHPLHKDKYGISCE